MAAVGPSSENPPFELSGGALCLDFANTWGDRARPDADRLLDYGELLRFALDAGLLRAPEASALAARAARRSGEADEALRRARDLRDAIARLFAAHARDREPGPADLDRLNDELARGLSRLRVAPGADGYVWSWADAPEALDRFLPPIARSAAELLTSRELARVRECDGVDCTWLFLDASRSRSRRWCSMSSCGNRAKARRHYRRNRGE